jgi:tetratricopeptide (TPR) repeat protein
MRTLLSFFLAVPLLLAPVAQEEDTSTFALALSAAEQSLEAGQLDKARELIERVLERDAKSIAAWELRARWAEKADNRDDRVYSLHQVFRLAELQGISKKERKRQREALIEIDPIARDLLEMKADFIRTLIPIAERYEKQGRPHSAIRVHKQIIALDPENIAAQAAIERIASAPDPSLAADAKPKDLFEDVSDEWIREHDEAHGTWEDRAILERTNYTTYSDAGYEVLVRTGEAMEQMNAFYRVFFQYGTEEDGHSVPKIGLNIFKNREEYLELGIGPPVEWSGGHFTGSYVETYIGSGGFGQMVGTLFHEAAHQFVSLATSAVGWLNEGLASFFEGTRILPNGTVIMNMPASHRLMPLAARMEEGWMSGPTDGIDPSDTGVTPTRAPTFRIVLENDYSWGPPWYAPTWGVVYFLYNYQDPVDGRFVYRANLQEFIDKSGGRRGEGAVENFEEVVLANPSLPLKGVERPEDEKKQRPPRTVEELDPIWKEWCLELRDELSGTLEVARPYLAWGRYAAANRDYLTAKEHFEKGLVASPGNIELLMEFGDLLSDHFKNPDRAVKLVMEALLYLERAEPLDEERIRKTERLLSKLDPRRKTLARVHDEMALAARAIVARYEAAGLPMMVMDVAWRLGSNLELPDLFEDYEAAVRSSGKSLQIWKLAYNEKNLDGWNTQGIDATFRADGIFMTAEFGEADREVQDYQFLTLDTVTSGDFSMEAKIQAERGEVNFCGFVFGQKDANTFHGLIYVPGRAVALEGTANSDYVDLMSSFGSSVTKIWRHVPATAESSRGDTRAETWRTLRLDISGRTVDFWIDGELLSTHEFPSLEVLHGSFGLLTGRGKCRFRDVRYLAREPRDRASEIERDIWIEKVSAGAGGAVGGSFLGLTPPWPKIDEWAQGVRESWDEYGAVPQLLVFFSIRQNELVPIDEWLVALSKEMEEIGLEIICVTSPNDKEKIAAYLAEHPFPGDVAVDFREGVGIGESFEAFFIDRFNLPRMLLIDLDGRVIWEGDPGIILGEGLIPPFDTYVDTPLKELIAARKLKEVLPFIDAWQLEGKRLLHAGDFPATLKLIAEAEAFDPRFFPEVRMALSQYEAVKAAIAALETTGRSIQSRGADPSLAVLVEWARAMGLEQSKGDLRAGRSVLESDASRNWTSAMKAAGRYLSREKLPHAERSADLLERLGLLEGRLVRDLESALRAAEGDPGSFAGVVADAEGAPARWLAREFFGW